MSLEDAVNIGTVNNEISVRVCLTATPTPLHKIQLGTTHGAKLTTATASIGVVRQQGPRQHSCRGTMLQLEQQLRSSYGSQAWHETTVKCGHRSRSYGKGPQLQSQRRQGP